MMIKWWVLFIVGGVLTFVIAERMRIIEEEELPHADESRPVVLVKAVRTLNWSLFPPAIFAVMFLLLIVAADWYARSYVNGLFGRTSPKSVTLPSPPPPQVEKPYHLKDVPRTLGTPPRQTTNNNPLIAHPGWDPSPKVQPPPWNK